MRTRLLIVVLPLLALVLVTFETALARSYAEGLSRELFIKRQADAERYAALADATFDGRSSTTTLEARLRRYDALHRVEVMLVDNEDEIVLSSRGRARIPADPRIERAIAGALNGDSPRLTETAWPWRDAPFVLGASVGRTPTERALVAIAPTDTVRERVAERLRFLVASGVALLLLAIFLVVLPVARWVLRPVGDLVAAAQDITAGRSDARVSEHDGPPELRGLARVFNRMAAAVAVSLARQRAFAADASHELRNPLTVLRLRMEGLALHVGPAGERELRTALDEVDRLSATTDMLLRLASAEATEAELADVDIVQTVAGRVAAWRASLAAAGISVELVAPDRCLARCHASAVEQALDSLLDNARKFAAGTALDVTITPQRDGVSLRVRDHGPGLSEAELTAAADRFWRSPRHQNVDGTGLGLTIARTLLESGGGRLQLHAATPGLVAELVLPAASEADPGPPAPTTAQPPASR